MQKAVNSVQELYRRWQDLLNNSNASIKEEFSWTTSEIKNNIRSVEWDLEDLEETIGIVESNPGKFTLSHEEIGTRKTFINNVRRNIHSIKEEINSTETKAKIEKNSRQVMTEFWKYLSKSAVWRLFRFVCLHGVGNQRWTKGLKSDSVLFDYEVFWFL